MRLNSKACVIQAHTLIKIGELVWVVTMDARIAWTFRFAPHATLRITSWPWKENVSTNALTQHFIQICQCTGILQMKSATNALLHADPVNSTLPSTILHAKTACLALNSSIRPIQMLQTWVQLTPIAKPLIAHSLEPTCCLTKIRCVLIAHSAAKTALQWMFVLSAWATSLYSHFLWHIRTWLLFKLANPTVLKGIIWILRLFNAFRVSLTVLNA